MFQKKLVLQFQEQFVILFQTRDVLMWLFQDARLYQESSVPRFQLNNVEMFQGTSVLKYLKPNAATENNYTVVVFGATTRIWFSLAVKHHEVSEEDLPKYLEAFCFNWIKFGKKL